MKTQPSRLLLVEDDPQLAALTQEYLEKQGFIVDIQENGLHAVEAIRHAAPDLLILDVMLPGLDGFGVCKQVRLFSAIPIIMLTALGEDIDELQGLENGADDYISKPVHPRLLLARIRNILRRTLGASETCLQLGALSIDKQSYCAYLGEHLLDLSTAEFELLHVLARHAGHVIHRDTLYRELRGFDYDGQDRIIDLRISRLRKKLEAHPNPTVVIRTIRGKGYLLSEDQA
jgi:DNA-binding response OmpR family regulator